LANGTHKAQARTLLRVFLQLNGRHVEPRVVDWRRGKMPRRIRTVALPIADDAKFSDSGPED
jgi:hypothetical protein